MKEIKIYIANLGKYNEGELVGEWFTLPIRDWEEVKEKVGLNSEYEEYAIHDYEAPFKIHEYSSIDSLNEIAERFQELNNDEIEAAALLLDHGYVDDIHEAIELLSDIVIHYEDDMASVAMSYYEENGLINKDDPLHNYVDWERLGNDMRMEGNFIKGDNFIIEVLF